MKILLVRHAACVNTSQGVGEFDRYLTHNGRKTAARAGTVIKERGITLRTALTSPLVRAVQTTEILCCALRYAGEVVSSTALHPGAPVELLVDACCSEPGDVLAVGHAPDMRLRAATLMGLDRREIPSFSRAMVMCVAKEDHERKGTFDWAFLPSIDDVVETLADLRERC